MNGRFLLDTNIVIGLFGGDASVKAEIADADEIFIPAIVLGELNYGATNSQHAEQNLEKLQDFASQSIILPVDENTAFEYGIIKKKLKDKGRPLPENDIRIAAIAQQHQLVLVTRDNHFLEVENLETQGW